VVEIVGLQLSLPLSSMYNPADALIQRCLMDQDLFLDVIDFTLRICAAQGLSASAGRLRLTLALAGSAWTVHSDDGALEQRVDPTYAAAAETAVEAGTTLGNSAGAQLAATWRAAYGRHPDPSGAGDQGGGVRRDTGPDPERPAGDGRSAHWCTLVVSVVEGLPMHPRCRRVIALLA